MTVDGIMVGGLTVDAATTKLMSHRSQLIAVRQIQIGEQQYSIEPADIDLQIDVSATVAAAMAAKPGATLRSHVTYSLPKLRALLEAVAEATAQRDSGLDVLRDTDAISSSFVLSAGQRLDVSSVLPRVRTWLTNVRNTEPLALELSRFTRTSERPAPEDLQQQLEWLTGEFDGIVGVYVYDLSTDRELASVNKGVAFTAASTIKTAIMLNAYIQQPTFSAAQKSSLQKMMIESDNLAANDILSTAVGSPSFTLESALEGASQMSDVLASLGLTNTFLYVPFEAQDSIKLYKLKYRTGPKTAGDKPYTNASRTLRTTPYEMAQVYRLIEECGHGRGILLDRYGEHLTPERCQDMIARLEANADHERMMSGLPADLRVAHKSGWIPPTVQGDVGIVRSPGGDFIISVFVWQPDEQYSDVFVQRLIGNYTRLVYSYYNPIVSEQ